jgi:hypothetical protein
LQEPPHHALETIRVIPCVEPVLKFREITMQMLYRDAMEAAYDPAFEQRKCGFDAVSVNDSFHIFSYVVADHFVFGIIEQRTPGRTGFIGHDVLHFLANMFFDDGLQRVSFCIFRVDETERAFALT